MAFMGTGLAVEDDELPDRFSQPRPFGKRTSERKNSKEDFDIMGSGRLFTSLDADLMATRDENVDIEEAISNTSHTFKSLLLRLEEEHEREVATLRNRIAHLAVSSASFDKQEGEEDPPAKATDDDIVDNATTPHISSSISPLGASSPKNFGIPNAKSGKLNRQGTMMTNMSSQGVQNGAEVMELWPDWRCSTTELQHNRAASLQVLQQAAKYERMRHHLTQKTSELEQEKRHKKAHFKCTCKPNEMSCAMAPGSPLRLTWDLAGFFVLGFDLVWIPLQAAFELQVGEVMTAIESAVLAYWTLDIVASFLTGYYTQGGELVMRMTPIAKRYVKGWFPLDVTIVGVDYVFLLINLVRGDVTQSGSGGSAGLARVAKVARISRIIRAMRLLRLLKLRELMYMIQEHIDSEWLLVIFGMLQNLMALIAVNHMLACVWYYIGNSKEQAMTWVIEKGLQDAGWGMKYLSSFHWALAHFAPGQVEILPQNMGERSFAVCTMVFSLVAFSSFVASITSSMTRLRGLKASKLTQYFMLRKFLSENGISRDLSARISRYIDLAYEIHKKKTDRARVDLLALLSGPLRIQLQKELFAVYLLGHEFFRGYEQTSLAAMSQLCSTAVSKHDFSKGDRIFECHARASHMFFLAVGSLVYKPLKAMRIRGQRRIYLRKGHFFSEAVLWTPWLHCGKMTALVESEVVALESKRFREVTASHMQVLLLAREYANEWMNMAYRSRAEGKFVYDVPRALMVKGTTFKEVDTVAKEIHLGSIDDKQHRCHEEVDEAEEIEADLLDSSSGSDDDGDWRTTTSVGANMNAIMIPRRANTLGVLVAPVGSNTNLTTDQQVAEFGGTSQEGPPIAAL